ncbi:ATP-binding protein [Telmatospirillum sp. J64-1]|uniref:ATP-binding protein n=1 Tax=Telmatospirillum sp. J64-1 TaxID=2502183 RepID=UPI00115D55E2|nr:ATP-binding protein [Telmatospirillum sp. J64-1]
MPRSSSTPRRLVLATLAVSTPALGALGVLVVADALSFLPAFAAALLILVLTGLLIRPYFRDFGALCAYIRMLAHDSQAEPPPLHGSGASEELLISLTQFRRAQEQRLADLQARLASQEIVVDNLPDPLFMIDAERRVVRANLAARQLFGREDLGRDLAAVMRDPAVLEACDQIIAGQPGRHVEFAMALPVERYFSARIEPLAEPAVDGTIMVLALHDVTPLKRMEQMRADFVANASHELRTPLATLLGFIETLRGPARDDVEARDRFLGIMFEQGSRMARLIEDLLSLSRIELNEHSQPLEKAELAPIVQRVAETLEPLARAKDMTIKLDMPDNLPQVMGQRDELAQLFQNLLDNAIKYGRDRTPIEVTVRRLDKGPALPGRKAGLPVLAVHVRDHGEGIPKEHLPRLTERFYRVDSARSRKMGGTGLGLAIVKHVVNRHRGLLAIDSTLGEGSIFTVYLPPAKAEAAIMQTATSAAPF